MNKKNHCEVNEGRSAALFCDIVGWIKKNEERKERGCALKENDEDPRARFDNSEDALITVGSDGKIRDFNETALRRYKYRREEFIGMPVRHLYSTDASLNLPQRVEVAMKYMEYGETTLQAEHTTSEGSILPTEINTRKVFVAGTPVFLFTCREI